MPDGSYQQVVTRSHPGCFVILVDQSDSMEQGLAGDNSNPKKVAAARAVNLFLRNLVIMCTKARGKVREYFWVTVLGYGRVVQPIMSGELNGNKLVSTAQLAENSEFIEDKVPQKDGSYKQKKVPVWIKPQADGLTPMCEALSSARTLVEDFIKEHPDSHPPIVVNITDGDSTDGHPKDAAGSLTNLKTSDGNVLLFNVHLSGTNAPVISFPTKDNDLEDLLAKELYQMSSQLPGKMLAYAKERGINAQPGARGFMFNADFSALSALLEIGTRTSTTA